MTSDMTQNFRSGFVPIVGQPNVGKSTLVNALVGRKVAIVTSKPQTTRTRILGIVNRPDAQVVLIDTPGIHRDSSALGRQMNVEIAQALEGIDLLAVMVDAKKGVTAADRQVFERISGFRGKKLLLLNKIDSMARSGLLPLIENCAREDNFEEIIPISALTGDGLDDVLKTFLKYLPEGEPHFPQDQFTDQPERFLAAEILREKAMAATRQELPHAIAVRIEAFEEKPNLIRIMALIQIERESQKGILIGKAGARLKEIGTEARKEMESFFGVRVYLEMRVTVEADWREDPRQVRELDWRRELEGMTGE
jgi:GTP-binding protein Era